MFASASIAPPGFRRRPTPFLVKNSRLPLLLAVGAAAAWFGVNVRHARQNDALAAAVAAEDAAAVHRCLASGSDANLQIPLRPFDRPSPDVLGKMRTAFHGNVPTDGEKYQTLLVAALGSGNDAILRDLLAHGARVNERTSSGYTALHYACGISDVSAVQVLLRHGADVHARDRYGRTPIQIVKARNMPGEKEIERLLIEHGRGGG